MWKCDSCYEEFDDTRVANERLNKEAMTFADIEVDPRQTPSPKCLVEGCAGVLRRMPDSPIIPQRDV